MKILHIFDETYGWEQRQAFTQLRVRLASPKFEHMAACVHGPTQVRLSAEGVESFLVPMHGSMQLLMAPSFGRWIERQGIDVLHYWGVRALMATAPGLEGRWPWALTLFDPLLPDRQIKGLRACLEWGEGGVACAAATIRRRLIERGVTLNRCVVIRPGVDFGAINQWRRTAQELRQSWSDPGFVIMSADAGAARCGHDIAAHTAIIRRCLNPHVRFVIPGQHAHRHFYSRWVRGSDNAETLLNNDQLAEGLGVRGSFEELLPVADVLLLPVSTDIATTAIAWAMASSVLVIAGAVYATAELLAHQHNGFLVKPGKPKSMAFKMASLMEDMTLAPQLKETARGQAFEVFSPRRCADQYSRLYSNLLEGSAPDRHIVDSATVA